MRAKLQDFLLEVYNNSKAAVSLSLICIAAGIFNISMTEGSLIGKTGSIILGVFCILSGLFTIFLKYVITKHHK